MLHIEEVNEIQMKQDARDVPHGTGRLFSADPRDYPLRARLAPEAIKDPRPYRYHNAEGWHGDQLRTNKCVGYGIAHIIEDGPVTHKGPAPVLHPDAIYEYAQRNDEWEGENYEGTSGRAGAKAAKRFGYFKEFRVTQDFDEVIAHLSEVGPIGLGTVWHDTMFYPDAQGFLRMKPFSHDIVGGHFYVSNGYNLKEQFVRIKNSWGRAWGFNGHAKISFDDLRYLLSYQGEGIVGFENKIAVPEAA